MGLMLTILMITNIIAAIVISVVLTGMELANLCGMDLPCIKGDGPEELSTLRKIRKYLKYGIKLLILPF